MPFENWEADHKLGPAAIIILTLILIVMIATTAYAVYKITSPPSDPVVVSLPSELSKPTVNATAAVIGETIQITTTLNDGVEGLQVFFYENDVNIGSAYTNSQGEAIINRVINNAGTFIYVADCIHP
jgi:hypothetical protein